MNAASILVICIVAGVLIFSIIWSLKNKQMNVAAFALNVHFGARSDTKHLKMVKGMRCIL